MNEILGLVDSLDATILEGKKIPFSEKIVLNEKKLLSLVDKISLALKGESGAIRDAVDLANSAAETPFEPSKDSDIEHLEQVQIYSKKIKLDAHQYAGNVLANLQLMVTKMQKEIVRLDKTIQTGRNVLDNQLEENMELQNEKK